MPVGGGGVEALFYRGPITPGDIASWESPGVLKDGGAGSAVSIGGTVTGGTSGSILFVDSGGKLAQDNANFWWDDTSNILKLASELDFQGATAAVKINGTNKLDYGTINTGWTVADSITVVGGTVTASSPAFNFAQTWNNAGVNFVGLSINVTNTASAGGSFLADWSVNSSRIFGVRSDGAVFGTYYFDLTDTVALGFGAGFLNGLYMKSSYVLGFSSGANWYSGIDVALGRNAAGVGEITNGTAATYRDLKMRDIITTDATFIHKTTTALTDNAGALGGTLLNAPAAGNPTKWIAIDDNGTTRFIPAW